MPIEPDRRVQAQVNFQQDLQQVLHRLREMLVSKNVKYGDAALNPNQTFSTASPIELINVRIDDKLSRIKNRQKDEDEDPEWDLLGYLVLKQIALMRNLPPVQPIKNQTDFKGSNGKEVV